MYDPNAYVETLDNAAHPTFFLWRGEAYTHTADDIHIDGEPYQCDIRQFQDVFGSKPLRTATWHTATGDFSIPDLGDVRATMEALLAAHPDITHFTLEPELSIAAFRYGSGACGNPVDGIFAGGDEWSPIDHPSNGWVVHTGGVDDSGFYRDGDPIRFLAGLEAEGRNPGFRSDWFVSEPQGSPYDGSHFLGPLTLQYADEPGDFQTYNNGYGYVGYGQGAWVFFLRPTTLTWPGQDPVNTANGIFWQLDDIAPGTTFSALILGLSGRWWSPAVGNGVRVRGYKLIQPVDNSPQPGTIFPLSVVSGRRATERSRVRGRVLQGPTGLVGGAPVSSTPGTMGTDEALSGVIGRDP